MTSKTIRLLLCFMMALLLSACATTGTGGGQKVQFDGQNSQAIVLSPYYLAAPQEQRTDLAWGLTLKVSDGEPYFGLVKPNQMLTEPLFQYFSSLELKTGVSLPEKLTEYAYPGCQGQALVKAEIDDQGVLKGDVAYRNFSDDCSLVIDGSLPFKGSLDLASGQLKVAINYKNLPGMMGTRSYLMAGRLLLEMAVFAGQRQAYQVKGRFSLDEVNGEKHRFENMLLSWDLTEKYPRFSLAGTVSVGKYGSADLVTNSPLISYQKDGPPFDGMLTFTGREGAWRRLYFPKSVDPGAFRIDGSNGMKTMGKI